MLTASGGAAGLDICKKERGGIHVIVSDVVMSGINGPRFMASAIRLCPDATAVYTVARWVALMAELVILGWMPICLAVLWGCHR